MRMVLFTLSFTFGVWLLQQQVALPDFVWAWPLIGLPLPLFIGAKSSSLTMVNRIFAEPR